jgi:hypothetical protein
MPEPLLRELSAAMVAKAMNDNPSRQGGARQRSLF